MFAHWHHFHPLPYLLAVRVQLAGVCIVLLGHGVERAADVVRSAPGQPTALFSLLAKVSGIWVEHLIAPALPARPLIAQAATAPRLLSGLCRTGDQWAPSCSGCYCAKPTPAVPRIQTACSPIRSKPLLTYSASSSSTSPPENPSRSRVRSLLVAATELPDLHVRFGWLADMRVGNRTRPCGRSSPWPA